MYAYESKPYIRFLQCPFSDASYFIKGLSTYQDVCHSMAIQRELSFSDKTFASIIGDARYISDTSLFHAKKGQCPDTSLVHANTALILRKVLSLDDKMPYIAMLCKIRLLSSFLRSRYLDRRFILQFSFLGTSCFRIDSLI